MKQLQNNFTTPEQSKRLLDLGVPADSADCYYTQEEIEGNMYWFDLLIKRDYQPNTSLHASTIWSDRLPAWSVGRLMEIYDICSKYDEADWPDHDDITCDYIVFVVRCIESNKGVLDFSKLED